MLLLSSPTTNAECDNPDDCGQWGYGPGENVMGQYGMGAWGETSCPDGYSRDVTQQQCMEVEKEYPSAYGYYGSESSSSYPNGCYEYYDGSYFWNFHPTGGRDSGGRPVCHRDGKCGAKTGSKWSNGKCKRECGDRFPVKSCHKKCAQYCNHDCQCLDCKYAKDNADWSVTKPKKHKGEGCDWLARQDPQRLNSLCKRLQGKRPGPGGSSAAMHACQYTCFKCNKRIDSYVGLNGKLREFPVV